MNDAAVDHAQLFSLATDEEEEEVKAKEQFAQIALDHPIECSCALPHGDKCIARSRLSDEEYLFPNIYSKSRVASAATLIVADFIQTAGFGAKPAYVNLDLFAGRVADRGVGLPPLSFSR